MENIQNAYIVAIESKNGDIEYTELLKSQEPEGMGKTLLYTYSDEEKLGQLIRQCGFKTCKKSFELLGLCSDVYFYESKKNLWWKNTTDSKAWAKLDEELKVQREITNLFKNFSRLRTHEQDFFIEKILLDKKTTNALFSFLNKNSYLKTSSK